MRASGLLNVVVLHNVIRHFLVMYLFSRYVPLLYSRNLLWEEIFANHTMFLSEPHFVIIVSTTGDTCMDPKICSCCTFCWSIQDHKFYKTERLTINSCYTIHTYVFVCCMLIPYSAKLCQGKTYVDWSFQSFGEENVGEFNIIVTYFSESGIGLGKILANYINFIKFAKVFLCPKFCPIR